MGAFQMGQRQDELLTYKIGRKALPEIFLESWHGTYVSGFAVWIFHGAVRRLMVGGCMLTSVSMVSPSGCGGVRGQRFSRSEQRVLLEEWASSEVTLASFCRQRGLPYDVFKKARRWLGIERSVVGGPRVDLDGASLDEVDSAASVPAASPRRVPLSAAWTPEIARIVITSWRDSGLSRMVFCRRYGIGLCRLDQWRRRLGDVIGPVFTAWTERCSSGAR